MIDKRKNRQDKRSQNGEMRKEIRDEGAGIEDFSLFPLPSSLLATRKLLSFCG
ncbi:hypothetical protein KAX35_04775 [candidate division WOR-3 bacterium]|nr:hypothetical protein [candidate division WOR-3 bacterium]